MFFSLVFILNLLIIFAVREDFSDWKSIQTAQRRQKNAQKKKVFGTDADYTMSADQISQISNVISSAASHAEKDRSQVLNRVSEGLNNLPSSENVINQLKETKIGVGQKKTLTLESNSGFNRMGLYKPSALKITEDNKKEPAPKASEKNKENAHVFTYSAGMGPVLLNGCFGYGYNKTDPCYKLRKPAGSCSNALDSAAFIGVGFDGRGFYSSQSRKMTLIQYKCTQRQMFLKSQLPDILNAFGIYNMNSETRCFTSTKNYKQYLAEKSQVASQKGMFQEELNKYAEGNAAAGDLATVGTLAGAGVGAYASGGNPEVISASADAGKTVGESMKFGEGEGKGQSNTKNKQNTQGKNEEKSENSEKTRISNSYFAILFINVALYEITIDNVTPDSISEAFLRDFLDLPESYFSLEATIKYQDFLLRYGTHYVYSAVFGGQLKIVKSSKSEKKMDMEEFSKIAEKEYRALTNTLSGDVDQQKKGATVMGTGEEKTSAEKNQQVNVQKSNEYTGNQQKNGRQEESQSQFTETTVESEGGNPSISKALFDFYTPSFKYLFGDWVDSISEYNKPFSFTFRAIDELLDINMDTLFPLGSVGKCAQQKKSIQADILPAQNKTFSSQQMFCKYKDLEDFKKRYSARLESLKRAIAVYMTEGATPVTSFLLNAGKPGCETDTIQYLQLNEKNDTNFPSFVKLKSQKFKVQFEMPFDIPNLIGKEQTFFVVYKANKWYSSSDDSDDFPPENGCYIPETGFLKNPICIQGVLLSYDGAGMLIMDKKSFSFNKKVLKNLEDMFLNYPVAKVLEISFFNLTLSKQGERPGALPCNIKWGNARTLDITQNHICIDFIAATDGDIFIIFAVIPRQHATWYYVQINKEGVAFYRGLKQKYARIAPGIGTLGDAKLFENYFFCLYHLHDNDIILQYGKSSPESEIRTVFASKRFNTGGVRQKLRFYSFGTGEKAVNFLFIRVSHDKLNLQCSALWVFYEGICYLNCHKECKYIGKCKKPADPSACYECKNYRIINGTDKYCAITCPSGFTIASYDIKTCIPCSAGMYKIGPGIKICNSCPYGEFSSKKGSKECRPCQKGTYSNVLGGKKCSSCQKGQFSSMKGARHCNFCPLGMYSDFEGSPHCKPCVPGEYSSKVGSEICIKCHSGTYNQKKGSRNCKSCPVGYEQPEIGSKMCRKCDPGHFSESMGTRVCKKCPKGTYQKLSGKTKCNKCPVTSKSQMEGAVSCSSNCLPGTYSPNNTEICLPCKPGTYQKGAGASECHNCSLGYFQPLEKQESCLAAEAGSYVKEKGATQSNPCPSGTANGKIASTSKFDCILCKQGSYSSEEKSTKCELCKVGKFQDDEGQASCEFCPYGYYSNLQGSETCYKCKGNSITLQAGSVNCTPCELGTVAVNGSHCIICGKGMFAWIKKRDQTTNCVKCPQGTYNDELKLVGKCKPCPKGTYAKIKGSSQCLPCEPGTYLRNSRTGCEKCKAGMYQSLPKSLGCKYCGPGYFSKHGSKQCTACPKGTYQSKMGQPSCIKCPAGSYSSLKKAKVCSNCQPGSFSPNPGAQRCTKCSAGFYQPKAQQKNCIKCPPGTYSGFGSKQYYVCPQGTFQNASGKKSCLKCAPGSFSARTRSTFCKPCPKNTFLDAAGGKQCKKCGKKQRSIAGSIICNGCQTGYEYGRIKLHGKSGSTENYISSPKCAFLGQDCLNERSKFWESSKNGKWPKIIYFKFIKKTIVNAFHIDVIEEKSPLKKQNFNFFGSNSANCISERTILFRAIAEFQIARFNNKAPFLCYGFMIDKSSSTAALYYPIKFYDLLHPSKCTNCHRGEYQDIIGGSVCLSCPIGTYQEKVRSSQCSKTCKRGTMTNKPVRATSCMNCPPGSFKDKDTSPTCYACEPGTRALKSGSTRCELCPNDWFMNLAGQKHCAACGYGCTSTKGSTRCYSKERKTVKNKILPCTVRYIDVNDSESHGDQNQNMCFSISVIKKLAEVKNYNINNPASLWDALKKTGENLLKVAQEFILKMQPKARVLLLPKWNEGKSWPFKLNPNIFPRKDKN